MRGYSSSQHNLPHRYGNSHAILENSGVFSLLPNLKASCRQQGYAGNKTLHQQNSPVLNWKYRLMQFDQG